MKYSKELIGYYLYHLIEKKSVCLKVSLHFQRKNLFMIEAMRENTRTPQIWQNMSCINEISTFCGTKKVFLAYERHELKVDIYSNACFQLDIDDRKNISQDMF